MAQTFATSPLVIYNTLVADATFLNLIGTYTFSDNTTAKSIAILTPGQSLPLLKKQEGLECIIHDSGDVRRQDFISDNSNTYTTWKLFLICWDPATGTQLDAAVKRIMKTFGGSSSIETVAASSGLSARVQTLVLIPETGAINPNP